MKSKAQEFDNYGYPRPDINCNSLDKLYVKNCWDKAKTALIIFLGDVFSVFRGASSEKQLVAASTSEIKNQNTSHSARRR